MKSLMTHANGEIDKKIVCSSLAGEAPPEVPLLQERERERERGHQNTDLSTIGSLAAAETI